MHMYEIYIIYKTLFGHLVELFFLGGALLKLNTLLFT